MIKNAEITATGRRKTSVARVRIAPGSGKITVNKREFEEYFPIESLRKCVEEVLKVTDTLGSYDVRASVSGGGINGQAGALRHAIARALLSTDEAHKPILKKSGMLERDARMKERKKPGQPGARKRFQFSKR
jgi:small subunit ribosomal protein S9